MRKCRRLPLIFLTCLWGAAECGSTPSTSVTQPSFAGALGGNSQGRNNQGGNDRGGDNQGGNKKPGPYPTKTKSQHQPHKHTHPQERAGIN